MSSKKLLAADDKIPTDTIDAIEGPASIPAGRPADLIARCPDIAAAEQRLQAQTRQVAALRSTTELARLRFEGGVSGYLEVLDAERSLFTTELDLNSGGRGGGQ